MSLFQRLIFVCAFIFYSLSAGAQDLSGSYQVTGFFFHPSQPRALNAYKAVTALGGNRYQVELGDLGSQNFFFQFEVDAANNLINWTAVGATPAPPSAGFMSADNPGGFAYAVNPGPGQAPWQHSTYNNRYDPATRTFYLHYGYSAGSPGQNGYDRQVYEKWQLPPQIDITSFTPAAGTYGTLLRITGSSLAGVNPYTVRVGDDPLRQLTDSMYLVSDTSIRAYIGFQSSGKVRVSGPTSGSDSIAGFSYTPPVPLPDAGWQRVGPATLTSTATSDAVLRIGTNNMPFVSYRDSATGAARVKSFNGSSWVDVGAAVSDGRASRIGLTLDGNNLPVVAYSDSTVGGKLTVKRYNGTQWQTLGSPGMAGLNTGSPDRAVPVDVDGNDVVYVAGSPFPGDLPSPSLPVTVFRFSGGSWVNHYQFGYYDTVTSFDMAVDRITNTPYLACVSVRNVFKVYKSAAGITSPVFTYADPVIYFGLQATIHAPSISISKTGVPLVSFQDNNGFERLSAYRLSGSTWARIGNQRFSGSRSYFSGIAAGRNGEAHVYFIDGSYNFRATVLSDAGSGSWSFVGARGFLPAVYLSTRALAIDTVNQVWMAFADATQGGKLAVVKRGQVVTSVATLDQDQRVRLFPIPANDVTYLETAADYIGRAEYRLLNGQGQCLRVAAITATRQAITVSGLPSGTYSLQVFRAGRLARLLPLQVLR
ncbi:MAG: hypothetical protein EOO11_05900 [Chitinophagaceae bacterium]|nr:MAG: hypothetical protein EOO11_05900 [Chitinophagaceae bacterium]